MSETKDWLKICSDCREGCPPKDCEYYGEPRGCNAPTYGGPPPRYYDELREENERLRAALKVAEDARTMPTYPNVCDKVNLVIREFEKVATRRPDGLTVIDCECSRLECAVEELKEAIGETSCDGKLRP